MGIPFIGLCHDLSKYSISELKIYKWYSPERSPHEVCREQLGYSPTHSLHKWRNKHHFEHWIDFKDTSNISSMTPIKIPYKYVVEMFCDMLSTGKVYYKKAWTVASPLEYYACNGIEKRCIHEDSERLLLQLLIKLYTSGSEKAFIKWYRKNKKSIKKAYNCK